MPKESSEPRPRSEEVLGSNPGDWEKKSDKKGGEYFELKDSVQEKKESEPNYDHIVEVLADFDKGCRDGSRKDYTIGHEVFEQDGFSGLSATWHYGWISSQGMDGWAILLKISPNPESWTDEDKRNNTEHFSKLLMLLKGIRVLLDFPPKKVKEPEEDDPFVRKFRDTD